MDHISGFFDKYKNFKLPDDELKTIVCDVLQNTIGERFEKKEIYIIHGKVNIKTNPHIKMKIMLHKEEILKKINEISGKRKVKGVV